VSRPVSAISAAAASRPGPGISLSRSAAGSAAAPPARPAPGPVTPSQSAPRDAGIAARCAVTRSCSSGSPASSRPVARSSDAAACACCGPNRIPDSASASAGSFSFRILPWPGAARTRGSRSPAVIAPVTARAVWCPASFDTTDVSLHKASSGSFSSRCQYRVRPAVRSQMYHHPTHPQARTDPNAAPQAG
jgi:hypothetical protein